MKKIILLTLLSLFSFQNITNAKETNRINSKPNISEGKNKLQSLTGEYNLLNYKVSISVNKENKLILTLPNVSESIEQLYNLSITSFPSLLSSYAPGIFPHHGDYELVPVSNLIFIIKHSNGYSIEIRKNGLNFNNDLIFRDANFDVIDQESFKQIIALYTETTPEATFKAIKNKTHVIIDVRELNEYQEVHIKEVKLLPMSVLATEINKLDRSLKYITVCRSGSRSAKAADEMQKIGINVVSMKGGMISWIQKGLPVVKPLKK